MGSTHIGLSFQITLKILYLIYGNYLIEKESGVALKILAKARALVKAGAEVRVINFSDRTSQNISINEHCTIVPVGKGNAAFEQIAGYIQEHSIQFDKILFRYPFASQGLYDLIEKFPGKIVFEHNTFELEEMLLVQKQHFRKLPFSWRPSYLKYWFNTYVSKNTVEKEWGARILSRALGGICVTKELAHYESKRCAGYKTAIVSNGASESISFIKEAPRFERTIKAFMLVGDNAPWQGFERIIEGLQMAGDTSYNIEVLVIGVARAEAETLSLPAHCKLTFIEKTDHFFESCRLHEYHFAFSTLGLYKKGMSEAASLKLRDSMLRGFPVVLGYNDTDVTGDKQFSPYVFQVPNDPSPLNFKELISFYKGVRQTLDYPVRIRKLAIDTFSYDVKARQMINVLEKYT